MFAPTESRAIASALLTFPTDLHQWELRNAAADEDMAEVSSVENLPPELQAALAAGPVLTAAGPAQARAPKGTEIGGQWIDTPGGVLGRVRTSPFAGYPGEDMDADFVPGRKGGYAMPLEDNSPETAMKGANTVGNMINCQKCTTVYEMRRRGMDVNAAPGRGAGERPRDGLLPYFNGPGVEPRDLFREGIAVTDTPAKKRDAATQFITDNYPAGARGAFQMAWKSGGAHVMNWERDESGAVHFVDAQIGRELTGKELTSTFRAIDPISMRMSRLDEAGLTAEVARSALNDDVYLHPERPEAVAA